MFSDALSGFINAGWALPWYAQIVEKVLKEARKMQPELVQA